jgi:outer membrane protein W
MLPVLRRRFWHAGIRGVAVRSSSFVGLVVVAAASLAHADPATPPKLKRLYVRGVISHVDPRMSTQDVRIDPSQIAGLAISDGRITDAALTVNGGTGPTAIVGYIVPGLRGRLSIETVFGVPMPMKIEATGRLANESLAPEAIGLPTGIPALGKELAEVVVAAPMLTAIFRPLRVGRVTVFVGVGASALFIYDEQITNPVLTAVGRPRLAISHVLGGILQGGLEARVWRRIVARVDAKYIAYRQSHATLDRIAVRSDLPGLSVVDVGSASFGLTVRPIILQMGLGADF